MMDEFLLKALIGGVGVALAAGPLGAFVAWGRMAYFGDTIAHSALLGVVIAYLFGLDFTLGIVAVSLLIALVLGMMQRESRLASDTLLGILAHGTLALGVVLISLSADLRLDLSAYLFGDILALDWRDVWVICAISTAILLVLLRFWRNFMMMVVHPQIAAVEGVNVERHRLLLMLLIALTVAMSIKVVGVLLITSLLIIPAAAARFYVRIPSSMAIVAALMGVLSVAGGLALSFYADTPSGPSIVVVAAGLFIASAIGGRFTRSGA